MSDSVSLPLLASLQQRLRTDESASDTYLGADESFRALLRARLSNTLILSLVGLVSRIIFFPLAGGKAFCLSPNVSFSAASLKGSLAGLAPFFWETETHHLHSGFSSKGCPSTFPWTLQGLFIVLTSPGKIPNAN